MVEQPHALEAEFQRLLADHPALLAGDQFDRDAPGRWLLIGREVAVASEQEGSGRWSFDHLFFDQDAIQPGAGCASGACRVPALMNRLGSRDGHRKALEAFAVQHDRPLGQVDSCRS